MQLLVSSAPQGRGREGGRVGGAATAPSSSGFGLMDLESELAEAGLFQMGGGRGREGGLEEGARPGKEAEMSSRLLPSSSSSSSAAAELDPLGDLLNSKRKSVEPRTHGL